PMPTSGAAAKAANSVTRTSSSARLRSGRVDGRDGSEDESRLIGRKTYTSRLGSPAMSEIGFVGLGKMGGNMVHRIRRDSDHEVVAFDFDKAAVSQAVRTARAEPVRWRTS